MSEFSFVQHKQRPSRDQSPMEKRIYHVLEKTWDGLGNDVQQPESYTGAKAAAEIIIESGRIEMYCGMDESMGGDPEAVTELRKMPYGEQLGWATAVLWHSPLTRT